MDGSTFGLASPGYSPKNIEITNGYDYTCYPAKFSINSQLGLNNSMEINKIAPRWKSWLLVGLQFGIVAMLVILSQPLLVYASLICYALGGGLGGWAVFTMGIGNFNVIPEVKTTAKLVHQRLPYRVIRHPMYLSLLLIGLGLMLQPLSWEKAALWIGLCVVLDHKARYEEQLLRQKFPEYAHYQTQTRRFIPYIY